MDFYRACLRDADLSGANLIEANLEATSSAAPTTTRRRGKARPANERRRRRQEAWRERMSLKAKALSNIKDMLTKGG